MTQYNFKKKLATVNTRIDPELKEEVEKIVSAMGFKLSEVIREFLEQIVIKQGLPFEVSFYNKVDGEIVLKSTL